MHREKLSFQTEPLFRSARGYDCAVRSSLFTMLAKETLARRREQKLLEVLLSSLARIWHS